MVLLVSDREDLVPAIRVALGEEVDFLRESLREFRWRIHSRDIDTTTAILIDARTMSADLNAAIDDIVPIRRHLYLFGIVPDGEVRLASDLTHRGLDRCVHASIDPRLLREVVIDTLTRYQRACLSIRDVPEIQSTLVGRSRVMQALRDRIRRVARYDDPVMILGESGVGKELVAHAVHTLSPRRDRPYRPVNVTALVDSLFESELFGVRRGAYTGAVESAGIFGDTEDGSVFLDEIGDLSHRCNRNSYALWNTVRTTESASRKSGGPTPGLSPRRTATCRFISASERFVRTCGIAWRA